MRRYVAFLRAINVTGRFVKMDVLANYFREFGHSEVETFITSGNVIFQSERRPANSEIGLIEQHLSQSLGFKSEVFVRSEHEVHRVAKFASDCAAKTTGEVSVILLSKQLTEDQQTRLKKFDTSLDQVACFGTEVYWTRALGGGASKFSNSVLERNLGVKSTLRRAAMLQRLSKRLEASAPAF